MHICVTEQNTYAMSENTVDKLIAIEFYEDEESYTSNHENYQKDNGWQLDYLNIHEQKILALLRSKKYETVIVHFKNEAISSLELVAEKEVDQKIVSLLSTHNYQDIVIKTHYGHITRIQQRIKIKMNKEP